MTLDTPSIPARIARHLRSHAVNLRPLHSLTVRGNLGIWRLTMAADKAITVDQLKAPPNPPAIDVLGPPMWNEIHSKALTLPDPAARLAYVATIKPRLPCGACQRHWEADLAAHPPVVDTAAAFFSWTVDRHNTVNTRKHKPILSLAAAHTLYSPPANPVH